MWRHLASFSAGLLFALGLGLSGMTDANKVIGFLNLAGDWDPSLGFVMVGAIGVHAVLYRRVLRRARPLMADAFHLPSRRDVDARLVGGAAMFGTGWALGGFCPGPGIVSLAGQGVTVATFVGAMILGMVTHQRVSVARRVSSAEPPRLSRSA
jgi:uncharacterized membrane protein YedE/YeeE